MTESNKIKCPLCGNEEIAGCIGGADLRPDEWTKQNIRYICTNENCLLEFGDNNITTFDNPKHRLYENIV